MVAGIAVVMLLSAATGGVLEDLTSERVWREFVQKLKFETVSNIPVEPYRPELAEPVRGYLQILKDSADWEELEKPNEFLRDGERVNCLVTLTLGGKPVEYCFSFVMRGDRWAFRHLEAITLRLDKIGALPVSTFPDLPEETKNWMREEATVTQMIYFFKRVQAEKGTEEARNWFKDGAGYALAAQAWIPYMSKERAFVLYLCWEQQRLRGAEATLETLTDSSAVVRLKPPYISLYRVAAHLKQQISEPEYLSLFEAIWQDRAVNGGWKLDMEYAGDEVVMRLGR